MARRRIHSQPPLRASEQSGFALFSALIVLTITTLTALPSAQSFSLHAQMERVGRMHDAALARAESVLLEAERDLALLGDLSGFLASGGCVQTTEKNLAGLYRDAPEQVWLRPSIWEEQAPCASARSANDTEAPSRYIIEHLETLEDPATGDSINIFRITSRVIADNGRIQTLLQSHYALPGSGRLSWVELRH